MCSSCDKTMFVESTPYADSLHGMNKLRPSVSYLWVFNFIEFAHVFKDL